MPNKAIIDLAVAGLIIAILVAIGICIGYLVWGNQAETVTEDYAPQHEMADGSVVASREPDGKSSVPEPVHPEGHKVVRTVEATVIGGKPVQKPDIPGIVDTVQKNSGSCPTADDFTCPPVAVRIDLLRDTAGGLRAQVSSNTGDVLDAVDIPREPIIRLKSRPWAAGYEQDSDGRRGAFIARDFGRITIGASLSTDTATARIGWRW